MATHTTASCTALPSGRPSVLPFRNQLPNTKGIRVADFKWWFNGHSDWSKTPSGQSKGGDCQRIMPRNKVLPFQQLMLKHQFKASGLKTCGSASWGQKLGSISLLIVREGGSENEFSVGLLSSHDTYNPHPT